MSIKFDLVELSISRMKDVSAGVSGGCWKYVGTNDQGQNCGCACAGPSSIYWNGEYNIAGGLQSPC